MSEEPPFYPPGCSFNETEGYKQNLTIQQRINLKLLKSRIREAGVDLHANRCKHPNEDKDAFLLRFLRARNFHVEDSRKLLIDDVEWRAEFRVDELLTQTCEQVLGCDPVAINALYPHWTHSVDKFGRPVMFEKACLCDIDTALQHTTHEALVRYHVWRAEKNAARLHAQTKKTGYQVDTLVSVVDVDNMSIRQVTRKFLSLVQEIAAIDQDHYPERLGQLFIINTPGLFGLVWSGIKPWLSPRTLEKINILTTAQVAESLQQFVDIDKLPEEYGGTCHCEGGCLPEAYNPDHDADPELGLQESTLTLSRTGHHSRSNSGAFHRRSGSMDSNATFHDAYSQAQDTEEFSDEELTPEEAAELELVRKQLVQTRRQFKMWNLSPYCVGIMLVTLGAYARAQLWYNHGVEWTAWCVAMSIMLGMMIFLVGIFGNYGLHASSPQALTWYSRLLFFFTIQVLIVGVALLALHDQLSSMLESQTGVKYDPNRIENFSIAFGACSLCAGVLLLIPCFVASNLKERIASQPDPIDDFAMVRTLVRILATTTLVLSLAAVGLGYACSLLAMYTSQYVFGMFVFTAGSVLIGLFSVFCIAVSGASKVASTVKMIQATRVCAWLMCLGLLAFIISIGCSFDTLESDVQDDWTAIQQSLQNSPWSNSSQKEVVSTLRWNRIFVIGCCILLTTLMAATSGILGTLQAYVQANVHDEEGTSKVPRLKGTHKAIIVWACVAASFQLFWEGQYLMFNHWVSENGGADDKMSESWFVSSWLLMGEADSRFKDQNDTIYVLELFTISFAMPLALFFAWATYAQRPSRHVAGIMACFLQIYHAMLYFGTEASAHFSHTSGTDSSKFWLIFVLVTALRFLIPIPIFVACWSWIVKAVSFQDDSMARIDRALPMELELKSTGFERPAISPQEATAASAGQVNLTAKPDNEDGDSMFSPLSASDAGLEEVETPLSFGSPGAVGEGIVHMEPLDLENTTLSAQV